MATTPLEHLLSRNEVNPPVSSVDGIETSDVEGLYVGDVGRYYQAVVRRNEITKEVTGRIGVRPDNEATDPREGHVMYFTMNHDGDNENEGLTSVTIEKRTHSVRAPEFAAVVVDPELCKLEVRDSLERALGLYG